MAETAGVDPPSTSLHERCDRARDNETVGHPAPALADRDYPLDEPAGSISVWDGAPVRRKGHCRPARAISQQRRPSLLARATVIPAPLEWFPTKPPAPDSRSMKAERTRFPRCRSDFPLLTRQSCGP